MAILFGAGRFKATDKANAPISGAFLQFYATLTSMAQPIYADSALTTILTNPVKADANGLFPEIWLDDSLPPYKVIFTSPDVNDPRQPGSIIWTIPQYNATLSGAALAVLLNPQTEAEITAGVTPSNYAYAERDLRRYGLSAGGSIDAALTAAISVCKTAGGGRIYIPPSSSAYTSAQQINLNQCSGIIIEGDGASTGGATNVPVITYTGSTNPWIKMTSALGCQIRNLELKDNGSGFTGAYIQCGNDGTHGDSFQCAVIDVLFNSSSTPYHLNLDKTTNFVAERCYFAGGATSVKGQTNNTTSYSTTVRFHHCVWGQTLAVPLNWGGQGWLFEGCTFEGVYTGTANQFTAGAFQALSTTQNTGLTFIGCWFGDTTDTGGTWVNTYGPGFTFLGNYVGGDPSPGSFGITLNGVGGAVIQGNDFVNLSVALNLASSVCKGLVYNGNNFNGVTTPLSGAASFGDGATSLVNPNNPLVGASGGLTPFFAAATQGWEYTPNGDLEIWGQKTITATTGATLTFATEVTNFPGFSTAVWNPQVTALNPGASVTNVYCASLSTTAMNVNANGTGTVTVSWRVKGK